MPAADQRRVPMKTITHLTFGRLGAQIALLAGAQVDPMNETFLTFGVENVAISRIKNDIKTVAAGESNPVAVANSFLALHLARANEIFVVLQTAGDVIEWLHVVERDAVKFARGNIK